MKKPSAKILQEFAKQYFATRCPIVRWKNMEYKGLADLKNNIIYLNPKIELDDSGCNVGTLYYEPRGKEKIKYKRGEQYFRTFLHEIAHFKIKRKPPKEWINLKRRLRKEAKVELRIEKERDKSWGQKSKTKKEEQIFIRWYLNYNAKDVLVRKRRELDMDYFGRIEDFRSWLMGDYATAHISVEKWARREFKKRRKDIGKLLLKFQ
jgi:hypothetical protein